MSFLFDSDDEDVDFSNGIVDEIVREVGTYVNIVNGFLETCESIYRVGYFPKVGNFYMSIGSIDTATCEGGAQSEIQDKIPIGVFFIYDIGSAGSIDFFIDKNGSLKNVESMKSATDVWYNYKINVVDFLYGCTNTSCRQRGFSTLTRLPIVMCLISDGFGRNLGIKGIVNHATTFGSGSIVPVNGVNMHASQLVLCKKLNFFRGDDVPTNKPRTWISHISNAFLTDEQNYVDELQNQLFATFLDSAEGAYYMENFFRTCVGYNTFLMLGEGVSLDTLPLLKNTIDEIMRCAKKDLLSNPCSQQGKGKSDKRGGKNGRKKSRRKNSARKKAKKTSKKKRKSGKKKRKSGKKKRKPLY